MKKHTIIGTAGHIDHGKTALIRTLTGIDTDRLKEERERGITIDIGFAYWRDEVTIIDVPGHEKLIRNMVAGVSTIDFFMLVIAADDGIMPQTIEHLDILNFFNIRDGIVIINKIDLVDQDWLELIIDEVKSLLDKYNLGGLPLVTVSALTGENIDRLKELVDDKIRAQTESQSTQPFRLAVDRSFTIKGFGTVVTGTVLGGSLKKGAEVEIIPKQRKVKVRGIQAHVKDVDMVIKGFRAAVNLQGISKEDIVRGDMIAEPDTMTPVNEFIGKMRTVSRLPLKISNRSRIHTYVGTVERTGQLIWFDSVKFLEQDMTYHVRIKLDTPIAAVNHDAFLVRLHSPVLTLAGGQILEINPPKIRHKDEEWKTHFSVMAEGDYIDKIETIISKSYLVPVTYVILSQKLFQPVDTIKSYIQVLLTKSKVRQLDIKGQEHFVHEDNFIQLLHVIENFIKEFHRRNPLKAGVNQQELTTAVGKKWIAPELIEAAIKKLIHSNRIKSIHNLLALKDFEIKISKDTDQTISEILNRIRSARFAPPDQAKLAEEIDIPLEELKSLTSMLANKKQLILVNRQFYLHQEIWQELIAYLQKYFSQDNEMPVSTLKDFIQTTRKYAIPIFEFLDAEGYTERAGDVRKRGNRL